MPLRPLKNPLEVVVSPEYTLCATAAGLIRGVEQMRVQFWNGDITEGDTLPVGKRAEREAFAALIAPMLGVSPSTISAALRKLDVAVENYLRESEPPDELIPDGPMYVFRDGGLFWNKPLAFSTVSVPLTNFEARIVTDTRVDDGAETRHVFTVATQLGARRQTFDVPASQFNAMSWPTEFLGAEAILYPGQTVRDHAHTAIRVLSTPIPQREVYGHLGWRQIAGVRVYLHGAGAIGPEGPVDGIEVQLPPALSGYTLPPPPAGAALHEAVRASLRFLDLAPRKVTVPLYGALWRSVLDEGDFGIHVCGPTGAGKTALAALLQQHFGSTMDARHLPCSWHSTANALEAIAFAAKDAMLVIDEFTPTDTTSAQALYRTAERLFRAQANRSGRDRMRADTSLRPAKPPRGLLLSTGEDIPRGQSLRARLLLLELGPTDVDFTHLTACQADAVDGVYAQALAGFVQWWAGEYERIQEELPRLRQDLRTRATQSAEHRRTPENVASLGLGWWYFLKFAQAAGAMTAQQAAARWQHVWRTLGTVAMAQGEHLAAADPTQRFMYLIREAIASKRAHLGDQHGGAPPVPESLGWRYHKSDLLPQGEKIGWVNTQDASVYLLPAVSYSVVHALGSDIGEPLTVSASTLRKHLRDQGCLRSTDEKRQTLTVRRVCDDVAHDVLHFGIGILQREDLETEGPPS
jgi:hypothetical protein